MTPKGSQRCRPRRRSKEDWHPSGVLFRYEPFTGGFAWDRRPRTAVPQLNHRLIAGKLPACLSRNGVQHVRLQ